MQLFEWITIGATACLLTSWYAAGSAMGLAVHWMQSTGRDTSIHSDLLLGGLGAVAGGLLFTAFAPVHYGLATSLCAGVISSAGIVGALHWVSIRDLRTLVSRAKGITQRYAKTSVRVWERDGFTTIVARNLSYIRSAGRDAARVVADLAFGQRAGSPERLTRR